MRVLTLVPFVLLAACKDSEDSGVELTDNDNDGFLSDVDCDDEDPEIHPGVDEFCDGIDHNCDGLTDFDAVDATTWYLDGDSDGYGDPDTTTESCTQRAKYVDNDLDCDDRNAKINPDGQEVCDLDNKDEDCDGYADDDDDSTDLENTGYALYPDGDSDGYGEVGSSASLACDAAGSWSSNANDCNDDDAAINPGETETCSNGIDDNCDGSYNQCGPDGERDLADYDKFTGDAGELVGVALAGGADITGDGKPDLVVGVPQTISGGKGFVSVYSGGATSPTVTLSGTGKESQAGAAVAMGDWDGDGKADLLVGAPNDEKGKGAVYLVSGPIGADADLDISVAWELTGGRTGATVDILDYLGDGDLVAAVGRPGSSVVELVSDGGYSESKSGSVGEVIGHIDDDDDGQDSLLLGAPDDGVGGRVYIYNDGSQTWIEGSTAGMELGSSVSGGGDVDGDGKPDLLVGAPGEDQNGSTAGGAFLYAGSLSKNISENSATAKIYGQTVGDKAGTSVCIPGDMDGDGYAEVVVGATGVDGSGTDLGGALLFYGPVAGSLNADEADGVLYGGADFDGAGALVVGAGDIDSDGYMDLAVGAPGDSTNGTLSGAAYLIYGGVW